jgi:hypothetical protein
MEAAVRDGVFAFDGRVLEIFARDGSARFHPTVLPELWIDDGIVFVRRLDHTTRPWAFDEVQRPQLELLLQAVAAVRSG